MTKLRQTIKDTPLRLQFYCSQCGFRSAIEIKPEWHVDQRVAAARQHHDTHGGGCAGWRPRFGSIGEASAEAAPQGAGR
jgi:hypothetical protein